MVINLHHGNAQSHIALPVNNLETSRSFYEEIFDAKVLAYGRSPGSARKDLLLLKLGPIALSFNEVKRLRLDDHFTMPTDKKLTRGFVGSFHFGLFELSKVQFELFKGRIAQKEVTVLDNIEINKDTPHAQRLMFIKDPDGYVIELRQSKSLSTSVAQTFEQQNEVNQLSASLE